ncbi:uncharacterized protein LOC107048091 [Diachasma alloeum]|uniref:uncharacterized protein LOC107048091 n=1 Tax=Diachasma alloeum TaxID=454923 RepID=UPI0007381AE7|nr:uncharacterized protein LOC107048091 [Diachasma alloeum]
MDVVEAGSSSHHRIPFHIQSWLDDVENFDTAEVGMVDFSLEDRGGYIGIATGMITRVGCGRALYSVETWYHHHQGMGNSLSSMGNGLEMHGVNNNSTAPSANLHSTDTGNRLEVLVCNYGPIDRTTPGNLYEDGMPSSCPMGFQTSPRYEHLCSATDEQDDEHWEPSVRSASMGQHYAASLLLFALHRSLVDLLSER